MQLTNTTVFLPPTVSYNPFLRPIRDHMLHNPGNAKPKTPVATRAPPVATRLPSFSTQDRAPVPSIRPPSVDSNLSDWSDCDELEFPSMPVRACPSTLASSARSQPVSFCSQSPGKALHPQMGPTENVSLQPH